MAEEWWGKLFIWARRVTVGRRTRKDGCWGMCATEHGDGTTGCLHVICVESTRVGRGRRWIGWDKVEAQVINWTGPTEMGCDATSRGAQSIDGGF